MYFVTFFRVDASGSALVTTLSSFAAREEKNDNEFDEDCSNLNLSEIQDRDLHPTTCLIVDISAGSWTGPAARMNPTLCKPLFNLLNNMPLN